MRTPAHNIKISTQKRGGVHHMIEHVFPKEMLLVEDNELNREIANLILTKEGIIVEEAVNGMIAVDKVANSCPGYYDLILMDIQMPVMDGYKATREIRRLANPQQAHIPIIAMTANSFDEDKRKALDAGMNAHIGKPIDVPKLIKVMQEFLAEG